jgi:plasmid stabilization system protein ParE
MKHVVIMPRAQRQIERAARWWDQHRDKAPQAFDEDLADLQKILSHSPDVGQTIRAKRPGIRRILMERVRYYVYYRMRDETIEIIFVWHSSRRPPHL